ncbi:uncharacterized protein LOC118429484 isoform X2 [Branchiostoma floridae]|uniref:Uncharacterized protein LOC118429484 isoform X2 n=1 Tax=Branchiostoma floridae TaxID=7739 RepID=A0A9J7M6X2_BRAFL|nr:uncharacterized protein LOC118429484 isoform X2 [Branchiostoma floridae]
MTHDIVTCIRCTGNETDSCGMAAATYTAAVPCRGGCWVFRNENTTSGAVTVERGCAHQDSGTTCGGDQKSQMCTSADNSPVEVCRRCCATSRCNHAGLTVPGGNAAPGVRSSAIVVLIPLVAGILLY